MRRIIIFLIIICSLAACNFPNRAIEPTQTPDAGMPCAFNWASQALPELSERVQAAIQAAGLKGVNARMEAFGENCYDANTNKVVSFAVMETDFHVTATVRDLNNKDDLGNLLEKILVVLDDFPVGKIPGPQPGYINISFQSSSQPTGQSAAGELNIMFLVPAGKSARAQGFHGAALLEALAK